MGAIKHTYGITLSGGGALGFAHLGALQALDEHGIRPTCLSGASMGALIGIFYASGMTAKDIVQMIKDEKVYKIAKIFSTPREINEIKLGLSTHKTLRRLFKKYIPFDRFEDMPIEFGVSVTNLNTEKSELISKGGNMKEYVLASMTQPAIFEPIKIGEEYFIDGGALNNLPSQIFRDKCEILIGVDCHPHTVAFKSSNIFEISLRCLNTMIHDNSIPGREKCDYLIESFASEKYNIFDFPKFVQIYKEGYKRTEQYIKEHPDILRYALID